MLFAEFMEKCVMMDKTTAPDGLGGFKAEWHEGAEFDASIVTSATSEQRVAEKSVGYAIFEIVTPATVKLDYHDVFKRVADGKIFRVTSDNSDVQTPKMATFEFRKCTAEEYAL